MGTRPWKLCHNKREVGHFSKLECGNNVLFAWTSKGVFYSESRGHYWHLVRPHDPSRIIQKQSKQIKLEGNKMSNKELLNNEIKEVAQKFVLDTQSLVFFLRERIHGIILDTS